MNSQGEIGDMCNQITDTLTSALGSAFTVQTLLSKKGWEAGNSVFTHACISSRFETNDFNVYFDPNEVSLAAGGNTSLPIHVDTTNGAAPTATLSISGLSVIPATVHASVSQATGISGTSFANLLISVDGGAQALRDRVIVVNATSGTLFHSA